jgi:hypothetical protein
MISGAALRQGGRRFDFARLLAIVPPFPKNAGLAPRPPRAFCDRRPYWDNNNLKRVGLI